jgi:hypothetical protein
MPSASLLKWQNVRLPNLTHVDAQCVGCLALFPPNPALVDENYRGYVLLLSAHFQGFCRDLYAECAQIVVSRTRASLQLLIQGQFTSNLRLDHGNPTVTSLKADFERFHFPLHLSTADPANPARITLLDRMNRWRNAAAHHGNAPAGIPLDLPSLRDWRNACDGLAISLDGIMYTQLRRILRRQPWNP